ncbi:hypothetical protein D0Z07_3737 [Hyphodiscus hymeniophilus]|uniref:Uncharacterized protein n=1 Tax=Hyphodiscus hymeniophilus TaxID=353542 RepID=A0A9P6VLX7_9HELO|nr:hypothetical protein D0Z07_3737 [Hyphodiscus hymeniophilus]
MLVPWPARKRERDEDEGYGTSGFSEHRTKRRFANLPDRTSPKQHRQPSPFAMNSTIQPLPPTITPADSEAEDTPPTSAEPRSVFSPYSSSPTHTITPSSPSLDAMNTSQSTQMSDVGVYSDDMEMADSFHLSPGPFHTDPSTSISGRIPTPIHSSFAPYIRAEKATLHHEADFADDEARVDRFRRGRRLPSPISEGDTSPSIIVEGLSEMQMEYEGTTQELEKTTPSRKGHTRSKHSLRSWTGVGELGASGTKRTFSMGYRTDCEKCRNNVPGHFNHIITYD